MRARVRGKHTTQREHRPLFDTLGFSHSSSQSMARARTGPQVPRCKAKAALGLRAVLGGLPGVTAAGVSVGVAGASLPHPRAHPARLSALHICGKEGRSPHSAGNETLSEPSAFISLKSQETETRTAVWERTHIPHQGGADCG